jgi:hypothetical protein
MIEKVFACLERPFGLAAGVKLEGEGAPDNTAFRKDAGGRALRGTVRNFDKDSLARNMAERLLDGVPEIAGSRRCDHQKNNHEDEENSQLGALLQCRGASQIFAQDRHGGNGIDRVSAVSGPGGFLMAVAATAPSDTATQFFFKQAFGFPARKPLIDKLDGNANLLAQTFSETGGFFGHVATGAIETERQPDDDKTDAMIAHKFAKAAHVFVAINAFEGVVWLGDAGNPAGQSEADFAPAIVEREDFALRGGGIQGGRFGNLRHQASIA